jgi:DNA polymerase-3 subunit delta
VFYIFHGDDEFGKSKQVAQLRGELADGDATMADLNTTTLDGDKLTMAELHHVCDTIPFMAERRVVIVHGLLDRLRPKGQAKGQKDGQSKKPARDRAFLDELAAYLPKLPDTTRLFFIENEELRDSHPILKLAHREEGGYVRLFNRPKDHALPGWIRRHTEAQGGEIDQEAAMLLATLVGNDLRQLDLEIEKLRLYAGERPATAEDVRALVARAREESIFDVVDCVGQREAGRALRLLHTLVTDGAVPLYVLSMLGRQFRILIQVKELGEQGLSEGAITKKLKLHPFVVKKSLRQARNFSMAQLEAAHQRLVETDWQIKTGQAEEELALDVLVVDLTRI